MADCFGPHRAGRIGRTCLSLMLAGLACLPLAAACRRSPSAHEERPATAAEVAPAERSRSFRIVGYVTDKVGTIDNLRYDRLTHINYAFLIPNDDGSVRPLYARRKLSRLVSEAHQHDVKVLLSVGGWGYDAEFEKLAANPESRARLVSEIVRHVQEYDLDGADMDWEYPDPGESAGYFLLLMQELSAAMRAESKLLTAAVVAEGPHAAGIPSEVFDYVDFLNIMAYDGPGEHHSPYSYAEEALRYWAGRGLPADKRVLGVPFYAQPGGIPYRQLVAANETAPWCDGVRYRSATVYHNSIPTLQRKVRLALREGSGIMIWALPYDTADATSLLAAIYDAVHGHAAGPPGGDQPPCATPAASGAS